MARKQFDKDFKLEAVNLVMNQKRPVTAGVRELGIHENKLYQWIKQATKSKEDAPPEAVTLALKKQRCEC